MVKMAESADDDDIAAVIKIINYSSARPTSTTVALKI